jgi:hypothetical protein
MACKIPIFDVTIPHVPGKLIIVREEVFKDLIMIIMCLSLRSRDAVLAAVSFNYKVDAYKCRKTSNGFRCTKIANLVDDDNLHLILETTYPYFDEICHNLGGMFGVGIPLRRIIHYLAGMGEDDALGIKVSVSINRAVAMYNDGSWSDVFIEFRKPYVTTTYTLESIMDELGWRDKMYIMAMKAVRKLTRWLAWVRSKSA